MSRTYQAARDAAGNVRPYLNANQLAEVTPWTVTAIRKKVQRGDLRRRVHYFQSNGPGSDLVFKWDAIVRLIEGAQGSDATVTPNTSAARTPRTGRGTFDVEKAQAGLRRVLAE